MASRIDRLSRSLFPEEEREEEERRPATKVERLSRSLFPREPVPVATDARRRLDESLSLGERVAIGTGRGAVDVMEGLGQVRREATDFLSPRQLPPTPDPANQQAPPIPGIVLPRESDLFTERAMLERELFEQGDVDQGFVGTGSRLLGNVLAGGALGGLVGGPIASGVARLGPAARTAATLAGGAVGGGTAFVEPGGSRTRQALTGAALAGVLAPVIGRLSNRLLARGETAFKRMSRNRRLNETARELASVPELTPDQRRRIALDVADGFTPEQAMRKFEIEEIGGIPTRGQVTGNVEDLRFEVDEIRLPQSEAGRRIQAAEQASRRQISEGMDEQVARLSGGRSVDVEEAGTAARESLSEARGLVKQVEDVAWGRARDTAEELGVNIRPSALARALDDEVDFLGQDSLRPIRERMRRIGLLDNKGNISDDLDLTPSQAEATRRIIGEVFDGGNRNAKRVAGKLQRALLSDVSRDAGEDVFREARRISAQRFAAFDNREKVHALLQGNIGPEQVVRRFEGAGFKAKDVSEFFETLESIDPPVANQLRASVLDDVFGKARGALDVDEVPRLTPKTFSNRLDAIGRAKLRAIFGDEEADALFTFGRRLQQFAGVDFRTAGPGTAGDLRRMQRLGNAFGRLMDVMDVGSLGMTRLIAGAFRAVSSGMRSRSAEARARRALNLELLKRENLTSGILSRGAVSPGAAVGVGAATPQAQGLFAEPDPRARSRRP